MGCVWAKAFKTTFSSLKIYVIAPVSLKEEWEKTAKEATGLKCADDENKGKKKKGIAKPEKHSLDMQICSWQKIPTQVPERAQHYVVICDEAHSMQNISSGRTKSALKLMKSKRYVSSFILTEN